MIIEIYSSVKESAFVDRIRVNTTRYVSLFAGVIDQNMPAPSVNFREDQMSTFEVIMQQRKFNYQQYLSNQASLSGNN